MAAPFFRAQSALADDRARDRLWWLAIVGVFLTAWLGWFLFAKVTLHARSRTARLEVATAVHPIAAQVSGRVLVTRLALSGRFERGEALVELEAESERHRLEEARRRREALRPQLEAIREQIAAEQEMMRAERAATASAVEIAKARRQEAEAAAAFADDQAQRLGKLQDTVSEMDIARARSEQAQRRASFRAQALQAQQLEADQRTRESQTRVRLEELRRRLALLEGTLSATDAEMETLAVEVERHVVRAPASGRLGEVAPLQVGSVLAEGERVGTLVPDGGLHVVAEFAPAEALGRLRPGQGARVRLDGFPWIQYGSLRAEVATVASEVRDDAVRVELEILPGSGTVPIQHGLPGSVDVMVERVTPAALVLRAIGQMVSPPATR